MKFTQRLSNHADSTCHHSCQECYMAVADIGPCDRQKVQDRMTRFLRRHSNQHGDKRGISWGISPGINQYKMNSKPFKAIPAMPCQEHDPISPTPASRTRHEIAMKPAMTDEVCSRHAEEPVALSASIQRSTLAILDTGASRCIVGEKVLQALKAQLPDSICNRLKITPSQVKFRFGNKHVMHALLR